MVIFSSYVSLSEGIFTINIHKLHKPPATHHPKHSRADLRDFHPFLCQFTDFLRKSGSFALGASP